MEKIYKDNEFMEYPKEKRVYNLSVEAIPIEWIKNKREELEKEYHDLFHVYTDESRNNQVQLLNDFHAFNTVLRYWEKENENRVE